MTIQFFSGENERKKTQDVNMKKEEGQRRWGQRSNDVGNNKAKISVDAQEKSKQWYSEARCCRELMAKALQVEAQLYATNTMKELLQERRSWETFYLLPPKANPALPAPSQRSSCLRNVFSSTPHQAQDSEEPNNHPDETTKKTHFPCSQAAKQASFSTASNKIT